MNVPIAVIANLFLDNNQCCRGLNSFFLSACLSMFMFNEISGFTVHSDPSREPQKDPHAVGNPPSALRKFT